MFCWNISWMVERKWWKSYLCLMHPVLIESALSLTCSLILLHGVRTVSRVLIIFKQQPLKKCCQSHTFKSNNVDLNCVKTQNRHWLLLPWLLDTMMEMVGHNNSSLLIGEAAKNIFLWLALNKKWRKLGRKKQDTCVAWASGCGIPPGYSAGSEGAVDNVGSTYLTQKQWPRVKTSFLIT